MGDSYIYRSNGFYLGFIRGGDLFSLYGVPLAWVEDDKYVWDYSGRFRGVLTEINGKRYIIVNRFSLLPSQRSPKTQPAQQVPPSPQANIAPISFPTIGDSDAF